MRLTPLNQLVPGVEEINRLEFRVASRSRKGRAHTVDLELRHGLGKCSCEDCSINGNPDCYHLKLVRKYLAAKVSQSVIQSHQQK